MMEQSSLTLTIYCTSFLALLSCFAFSCVLLLKLKDTCSKITQEKKDLFSQKRSTEVRTGHIVEKFAPFLNDFPYDPETAYFIGKPIDYLVFDEDMVRFLEIKSGGSRLTSRQRHIRNLIKDKKVSFEEIHVTDEEVKHRVY